MEFKPLPIGIDNFEKLITREYFFIDKTLLIKDLLDNKADDETKAEIETLINEVFI